MIHPLPSTFRLLHQPWQPQPACDWPHDLLGQRGELLVGIVEGNHDQVFEGGDGVTVARLS